MRCDARVGPGAGGGVAAQSLRGSNPSAPAMISLLLRMLSSGGPRRPDAESSSSRSRDAAAKKVNAERYPQLFGNVSDIKDLASGSRGSDNTSRSSDDTLIPREDRHINPVKTLQSQFSKTANQTPPPSALKKTYSNVVNFEPFYIHDRTIIPNTTETAIVKHRHHPPPLTARVIEKSRKERTSVLELFSRLAIASANSHHYWHFTRDHMSGIVQLLNRNDLLNGGEPIYAATVHKILRRMGVNPVNEELAMHITHLRPPSLAAISGEAEPDEAVYCAMAKLLASRGQWYNALGLVKRAEKVAKETGRTILVEVYHKILYAMCRARSPLRALRYLLELESPRTDPDDRRPIIRLGVEPYNTVLSGLSRCDFAQLYQLLHQRMQKHKMNDDVTANIHLRHLSFGSLSNRHPSHSRQNKKNFEKAMESVANMKPRIDRINTIISAQFRRRKYGDAMRLYVAIGGHMSSTRVTSSVRADARTHAIVARHLLGYKGLLNHVSAAVSSLTMSPGKSTKEELVTLSSLLAQGQHDSAKEFFNELLKEGRVWARHHYVLLRDAMIRNDTIAVARTLETLRARTEGGRLNPVVVNRVVQWFVEMKRDTAAAASLVMDCASGLRSAPAQARIKSRSASLAPAIHRIAVALPPTEAVEFLSSISAPEPKVDQLVPFNGTFLSVSRRIRNTSLFTQLLEVIRAVTGRTPPPRLWHRLTTLDTSKVETLYSQYVAAGGNPSNASIGNIRIRARTLHAIEDISDIVSTHRADGRTYLLLIRHAGRVRHRWDLVWRLWEDYIRRVQEGSLSPYKKTAWPRTIYYKRGRVVYNDPKSRRRLRRMTRKQLVALADDGSKRVGHVSVIRSVFGYAMKFSRDTHEVPLVIETARRWGVDFVPRLSGKVRSWLVLIGAIPPWQDPRPPSQGRKNGGAPRIDAKPSNLEPEAWDGIAREIGIYDDLEHDSRNR